MKRDEALTKTVTYKDGRFTVKRTVCSIRGHLFTATCDSGADMSAFTLHDTREAEALAALLVAAAREPIQLKKE